MMALGKQQIYWDRPERTVDCLRTNVSWQREADECVFEWFATGLSALPMITEEQG